MWRVMDAFPSLVRRVGVWVSRASVWRLRRRRAVAQRGQATLRSSIAKGRWTYLWSGCAEEGGTCMAVEAAEGLRGQRLGSTVKKVFSRWMRFQRSITAKSKVSSSPHKARGERASGCRAGEQSKARRGPIAPTCSSCAFAKSTTAITTSAIHVSAPIAAIGRESLSLPACPAQGRVRHSVRQALDRLEH